MNVRVNLALFTVAYRTASAVTTSPAPRPELQLIRARRDRLSDSLATAGKRAGITGSYWKQIEDGTRALTGPKGRRTLARMAYAVGVEPGEMTAAGRPDLAAEMEI